MGGQLSVGRGEDTRTWAVFSKRRISMTIKIMVAADHEVVRSGLASVVAGTEIKIVAEAKNPADTVKTAQKIKPDVLLLDVRMGDLDGLEALEKLHKQLPHMKVVVFSAYDNPTYVARS